MSLILEEIEDLIFAGSFFASFCWPISFMKVPYDMTYLLIFVIIKGVCFTLIYLIYSEVILSRVKLSSPSTFEVLVKLGILFAFSPSAYFMYRPYVISICFIVYYF